MSQISPSQRLCPACNAAQSLGIGQKNGIEIVRCQSCSTVYVTPLPREEEGEDYDAYYTPQNLETPAFISKRLDEIVATFSPYQQNKRFLDVGFGAGDLLRAADRAGWQAEGIEVSLPAVEYAQNLGLQVFHGDLAAAQYPPAHFDVVTAVEVLEHVPDPLSVMQEIARILRPGGLLWATTPHGNGISARLLKTDWSVVSPPEHLQLLSVKGAEQLLRKAGFQLVDIDTHGANPQEIQHVLRSRKKQNTTPEENAPESEELEFSRNETAFQLNQFLVSSPSRRLVKDVINGALNLTHLGDSLKIRAVR